LADFCPVFAQSAPRVSDESTEEAAFWEKNSATLLRFFFVQI